MADDRLYELRVYYVAAGRMNDMIARLRDHLLYLFKQHGIEFVTAWQDGGDAGSDRFIYLVRYASFEVRAASWARFYADPAWVEARRITNAGSDLVLRTDLYPLRAHAVATAVPESTRSELAFAAVPIGTLPGAIERLKARNVAGLQIFEPLLGPGLPALFLIAPGETMPALLTDIAAASPVSVAVGPPHGVARLTLTNISTA